MIRLAADENLNNDILRGLLRHKPGVDVVRVQDAGLSGAEDPDILAWAAREDRILLTHDVSTMTHYALERVRAGEAMPGIFEIDRRLPIGSVIEDLLLIIEFSLPGEWEGQVRYLPLR